MDFSKIICIELTKYNNQQLSKIADILGIDPDPVDTRHFSLFEAKRERAMKVYFIPGSEGPVAVQFKDGVKCDQPLYNGLFIYPAYRGLSKKEKDKMLKIKSFDFFESKKVTTKVTANKTTTTKKVEDIILDVDTILDKISQFGLQSLLKEEKDFLDSFSK